MARIIIKHLGTIKEFEMDMKEYHLLTGEQAANRNTISQTVDKMVPGASHQEPF